MVRAAGQPRIFVQIPAYRDVELAATLRSLYGRADHPDRLRTVVCRQRDDDEPDLPARVSALPGLTVLECSAAESRGPNWARRLIQQHHDGEELTLLLDSHMRFVDGWDALAVGMLDQLTGRGEQRPVLTGYLPAYVPGAGARGRRPVPMRIYPLSRDGGVLTRLTSYELPRWRHLDGPVEADFLSLHFVLTTGDFNEVVPHDPDVYFFGDEVALGCRAYTFGWTLWHPHRVLGWHAYDRRTRVPHWRSHPTWADDHRATLDRLRALFSGDPALGHLLGRQRTVGDYERHIMHRLVTA